MKFNTPVHILEQRCRAIAQLLFAPFYANPLCSVGFVMVRGRSATLASINTWPKGVVAYSSIYFPSRRVLSVIPSLVKPGKRPREDTLIVWVMDTIFSPQIVLDGKDERERELQSINFALSQLSMVQSCGGRLPFRECWLGVCWWKTDVNPYHPG